MPSPAIAFTLAILPLTKGAGSEEYAGLGKALSGMITTDLAAVEEIQLVERERLEDLLGEIELSKSGYLEAKTAQKLGKGLGASYLVTGSYSIITTSFLMDARIVAVESGKILEAASAKGTLDDFVAVEKSLVEDLLNGLSVKLSSAARRKLIVQTPTESFKAFKAYGEGLDERDRGRAEKAREAFQLALAIDPKFAEARTALESLSQLVEREKEKERASTEKINSAVHQKILERFPDERKRPATFQDDLDATAGFVLRAIALENEKRYCQRYEEMLHFLERRKWRLPSLDRRFTSDVFRLGETFAYQLIHGGPGHLDDSVADRSMLMLSINAYVIGARGYANYGESDAMISALKKCFAPERQLEEIDRLIDKATKAGIVDATADHTYPRLRLGEALDLTWCNVRAKHLGANAELERRTKRLLDGRPEGDQVRKQLLQEIESVARDAKEWSDHQARRLGQPKASLERVVRAVAAADQGVVSSDGPLCGHLMKSMKTRADGWLLRERGLAVEDERARDYLLDEAGAIFGPLRDVGCLVGVPARFEAGKQVLEHQRTARQRMRPGADRDQTCISLFGASEQYAWDQIIKMIEDYPQQAPMMVEGMLLTRYAMMSSRCVDD